MLPPPLVDDKSLRVEKKVGEIPGPPGMRKKYKGESIIQETVFAASAACAAPTDRAAPAASAASAAGTARRLCSQSHSRLCRQCRLRHPCLQSFPCILSHPCHQCRHCFPFHLCHHIFYCLPELALGRPRNTQRPGVSVCVAVCVCLDRNRTLDLLVRLILS